MNTNKRYAKLLFDLMRSKQWEQAEQVYSMYQSFISGNSPIPRSNKGHKTIEELIEIPLFYRLEMIYCGKHCKKCPHGPYWYVYLKRGESQIVFYIGKQFRKISTAEIYQKLSGRANGNKLPQDTTEPSLF